MKSPSISNLRDTYEYVKNLTSDGVSGVLKIRSDNPGPTLGVTICTHGNEPSGLAPLWYYLQQNRLWNKLQKGTVIFVINNLKATGRYFSNYDVDKNRATRFVDVNFNRLPEDALSLTNDSRYEIQRLQELYPIYSEFDVALDIHSTSKDSPPMIIASSKLYPKFFRGFPITVILSNMFEVQIGIPVISFYGGTNREIPIMGIECGPHENPRSFEIAIQCTKTLLYNLEMIANHKIKSIAQYEEYRVSSSLMFPNASYKLVKSFSMFETVEKGQTLAIGDGKDLISPHDGHVILAPNGLKPEFISEEVLFITKPVNTITVQS